MSKKKYKFSIIVPIYNVEEYLKETIESIINQTIGFEENVQLILVNDGSPDNSESICLEYKEQYPENIVYVKQQNGGVSSARNNGMKYMEGEYINFLDSDDLWQKDALEKVYSFFQKHKNKIDVVATPMEFFDAKKGMNHPLNWKFSEDKVVDLWEEPNLVQMHAASCFIKRKAIDVVYDKKLKYAEDSLFINQIILKKLKYGILTSTHYMYRKRADGSSAMDKNLNTSEYYLNTIKNFHYHLADYAKKVQSAASIPPYIQYCIMYDLQWRLKSLMPKTAISESELKVYRSQIVNLLKEIDNDVILKQRNLSDEYKIFALRLKNNQIFHELSYVDGLFYYDDKIVYKIQNEELLNITLLNIRENNLELSAKINCPLEEKDFEIYYIYNGQKKKVLYDDKFIADNRYALDQANYKIKYFNIKEKLEPNKENIIKFYFKYKEEQPIEIYLNFLVNAKLERTLSLHYVKDNYMAIKKGEAIVVKPHSYFESAHFEIKLFFQLILQRVFKQVMYRLIYNLSKITKKKKIWLVSDRISVANDNGMHMFKYLSKKNLKDTKVYFVIKKDCEDYKKMKAYGRIINYNSLNYKIKFLLADKIISSQADEFLTNAFGRKNKYYRDLYRFDFIFLQHGIIKDDLSTWLNIYQKNIRMFVTSVVDEYNSVINGKYGYTEDVVKLTGLPRYDNLKDENKKIIAIMPTWRKSLATHPDRDTGIRAYSTEFKKSEYFKFYNNLINDQRILDVMKDKGYKGIFVVHPSHVANEMDFEKNELIEVIDGYADYQEIFRTSSLLISDFSSVPFDFAYLYKPVIYAQFDKENFFKSHLYQEGYFKYEKDGLGPVCPDYETTVKTIISYIKNDCKLEEKYKKRIDKFYKYHDKNNCKRVLEEIEKI